MSETLQNQSQETPGVQPVEGDAVMQEALAARQKAQEAIDQARRNIAEGTALHTSSNGVVETPRDSAAIANGETDALK